MKYLFIITAVLIEIKSLAENFKTCSQWAAGGFAEFLNIMNFYVFLIVWDNTVNKL